MTATPETQRPPARAVAGEASALVKAQANGSAAAVQTSTPPMLAAALDLQARGFAVHWLKSRQKAPAMGDGWQLVPVMDAAALRAAYRPGQNLGIRCGRWSQPMPGFGLVILDLDAVDAESAAEGYRAAEAIFGDLTRFPTVRSGSGHGRHLYAVADVDAMPATQYAAKSPLTLTVNGKRKARWAVQVLATGAQVVAPPSVHPDTGAEYQWHGLGLGLALPELFDLDLRIEGDGTAEDGNPPPDVEAADLDALRLPQWQREAIQTGRNAKGNGDRSEVLWAVLRDLAKAGATDAQVLAICTDPANGISAKPLEKRNPRGWLLPQVRKARREIEREREATAADVAALIRSGKTDEAQAILTGKPTAKGREYRLDPAGELIANRTPRRWLVARMIERDTTGAVFGPSGSCKTFAVLDLAACIATALDWHGHKVTQGPVAILLGEGNAAIGRRLLAWSLEHGVDLANAPLYVSNRAIKLDATGARTVADVIATLPAPPVLIVIDTLARHFPGEENSNAEMGAFLGIVDEIARSVGAALLLVHHTGHGAEQRERGASALRGALDWSYLVHRTETGQVAMTAQKSKDDALPAPKFFRLHPVELPIVDEDGEHETSAVLRLDAVQESPDEKALGANQLLICDALRKLQRKADEWGPPCVTVDELRAAAKLDRRRWADAFRTLTERGLVKVEGQAVRLVEPKA